MSKDKLDSIKLQILRNKNLSTTIDKKQYTLSDINDLVNKIDKKKVSTERRLLIFTMILQKKVTKIAELRQTKSTQNFLGIINSLEQIYDEQPDTNKPDLETGESAAERRNQQGQGLKILTPNQMLSRLPTTLAQLKAGNNSEKLKNEIRQLLYSFYRSKRFTKQLYKSLIDII